MKWCRHWSGPNFQIARWGSTNPMVFFETTFSPQQNMHHAGIMPGIHSLYKTNELKNGCLGDKFFFCWVLQPTFRGSTAVSFEEGNWIPEFLALLCLPIPSRFALFQQITRPLLSSEKFRNVLLSPGALK